MRTFLKHFIKISLCIMASLSFVGPAFAIEQGACVKRYQASNGTECCMFKGTPDANIWGLNSEPYINPQTNEKEWFCGRPPATDFECYCRALKSEEMQTAETKEGDAKSAVKESKPLQYTPQVSIPGSDSPFTAGKTVVVPANTQLLAGYIIAIFKYSTGIVGIIAIIVVMVGGVRWLTAAGGAGVSEAKTMIISGVSGLALTLGSFLLLTTINTSLVNFKVQPIKQITKIDLFQFGCCEKINSDGSKTTENLKDIDCRALTGYKSTTFKYGYKADANECKPDSQKQACCLYGYDKNNNIPGLCRSKLMANGEALNNFQTECKGLADQVNEDKYIKGIFSVEASKECRDDKNTGIAKCINPE